jgi:hypothetical protein
VVTKGNEIHIYRENFEIWAKMTLSNVAMDLCSWFHLVQDIEVCQMGHSMVHHVKDRNPFGTEKIVSLIFEKE